MLKTVLTADDRAGTLAASTGAVPSERERQVPTRLPERRLPRLRRTIGAGSVTRGPGVRLIIG